MKYLLLALLIVLSSSVAQAQEKAVDDKKLLTFLPEPPEGWQAEPPESSTLKVPGRTIVDANRTYTKGEREEDPSVTVTIIDSTENKQDYEDLRANWVRPAADATGQSRATTIDGFTVHETIDAENKAASLWVVVGDRYYVQVEMLNGDAKELEAWAQRVDLKKLAELKP